MDSEPLQRLRTIVRTYESAITAFSAGVDSTLVAVVAQQELGNGALAATAVSASLAPSELDDAVQLAKVLGLNHRLVQKGSATAHHVFPHSGWISFFVNGPEEVAHALELIQIAFAYRGDTE